MSTLWGEAGPARSWKWDSTAEVGSTCDIVADLLGSTSDSWLVKLWPCGRQAKVLGSLTVPIDCSGFSIFDACLIEAGPVPTFFIDVPEDVLYHRRATRDDFRHVIELCAGLGIGAMGFAAAGMKVVGACDWSAPFTCAFTEIHPDIPVVTGDIGDKATIRQLHRIHNRPSVLMSGFSCQPYSRGGLRKGVQDSRSDTLGKTLRASFMLRSLIVVLECVQDAGSNAMVRQELDQFRHQCGFHLSEVLLKSEEVWVSRRARWWATLSTAFVGPVPLQAFVHSMHPTVPRQVLSSPMVLSADALSQLELTGEELARFLRFEPQLTKMLLRRDSLCPTALHSWGSQAVGCQCLCRNSGFSDETLSRGLFGILLPVTGQGDGVLPDQPRFRHPHPLEVGLLNGVPELVWPSNLRLVLAGLGQMCSPLHTVWVGSQIQAHVDRVFTGTTAIDPQALLDQLKGQVLDLASHVPVDPVAPVFLPEPPVPSMDSPFGDVSRAPWSCFQHGGGLDSVTVVLADDPVPFQVRLSSEGDTVAAVLQAWFELAGEPIEPCKVVDCQSGLTLSAEHPASGLCLWIAHDLVEPGSGDVVPLDDVPVALDSPAEVPVASCPAPLVESSSGVSVRSPRLEPLVALDASSLVSVPAPSVSDLDTLHALRKQTISVDARKQILAHQGAIWADDELMWHVSQMLAVANKPGWAMLDPLIASEALKQPSSGLLSAWIRGLPVKPTAILGLVIAHGHWIPFIWTWTPHCMIASSWDVPGSPPHEVTMLHTALALAVGARTHTVHVVHRKFAVDSHCGLCALRFLDHMIRGKMLPTDMDEVKYLQSVGRSLFVAFLDTQTHVPRPWMWGAGLDAKAADRLHALLLEHGVEEGQVKHRAHLLVQAVGPAVAQKALTSGQPWRGLKQAANNCRPVFQLVLPDELERSVKRKAEQGGLKTKRKKAQPISKSQAKPEPSAALDPCKLVIEDDSFVGPDGSVLAQLGMLDVGPLASGVVLTTVEEASAFLKAGQLVSPSALALLVLNVDGSSLSTSLQWASLRVVLRCQANGEPLLAPAVLVQLGEQLVTQKPGETLPAVMHTSAACVKIALYRDCVEGDWNLVVQSPVKFILTMLEPLQTCQSGSGSDACTCPKWHPSSAEVVGDPVVDVWRRQWVTSAFRPSSPGQADIFLVNFRIIESLLHKVLGLSGRGGLYLEPRSLDGKNPLLDFQILWLARTPHEELLRLQQCNPRILGLARLGARLGVRCLAADAPDLAKTLKPSSVYLAAGTKLLFEVGPLPFGMDRLSVSKLCGTWGWQARPLHPSRSAEGALGNVWLVQASVPPPNPVVRYQGNEIVINTVPDKPASSTGPPAAVVGNVATVKMCTKDASPSVTDPWLLNDPWAPPGLPVAPRACGSADTSLKEFESRLEKSILAKMPAASMEVDSTGEQEARLIALEHQVNALTAGQQQLDAKIDESSARAEHQFQSLNTQVHQEMESLGHQMQALFSSQMQQIEALLSKKLRTE